MNENLKNSLTLVDVCGGKDKFESYKSIITKTLPKDANPVAYWPMYAQIMQKFINDKNVTNKKSVITACYNAPKLGLNPDPIMGQIYFIPYKGVLTYQIGYKGMIELARRAGIRVRAGLVYENDVWHYHEDENGQHFNWQPKLDVKNKNERGREIFAFSIFTDTATQFAQIHLMESYHIDEVKKLVLARMKGASTPWIDPLFEPEMRKKTCVRRHSKTEPMSIEIARAIEHEESDERGETNIDAFEEIDSLKIPDQYLPTEPDFNTEEGKNLNKQLDAQATKA